MALARSKYWTAIFQHRYANRRRLYAAARTLDPGTPRSQGRRMPAASRAPGFAVITGCHALSQNSRQWQTPPGAPNSPHVPLAPGVFEVVAGEGAEPRVALARTDTADRNVQTPIVRRIHEPAELVLPDVTSEHDGRGALACAAPLDVRPIPQRIVAAELTRVSALAQAVRDRI